MTCFHLMVHHALTLESYVDCLIFMKLYSLMFTLWCVLHLHECDSEEWKDLPKVMSIWLKRYLKLKVTQPYLTLCNPEDYTVHGILQTRILKWVTLPFSRGSSQPRNQIRISCIAGRCFTSWATMGPQILKQKYTYPWMKICMSSLGKCLLHIFSLLLIELLVF